MSRLDGEQYRPMKIQSSHNIFHRFTAALIILFIGLFAQPAFAVITASPEEMATAQAWWAKYLGAESAHIPFSFRYGDQPVDSLLAGWTKTTRSEQLSDGREQHTITWKDPKTGLEVRSVAVRYGDYPVVEWTVYFKNAGAANTPILSDIQALDVAFQRPAGKEEFVLNGNKGDFETADMGSTLRTPRYRYIEWRDAVLNGNEHVFGTKAVGVELYDYIKDPLERENLAGKVEYQKVLQEHQELFDRRLSYLPKRSP